MAVKYDLKERIWRGFIEPYGRRQYKYVLTLSIRSISLAYAKQHKATGEEEVMSAAVMERPREKPTKSDAVINVRLPTRLRDLIDRAAAIVGKTRTDFILESARKHAVDVLLDQRLFSLETDRYEEFLRVLDQPPESNERLKQLLASKSPWEK